MLGRLARDLRLLGYDVAYAAAMNDDELLALAREGGRVLVTRDRELASRASSRGVLLRAGRVDEELAELVSALDLRPTPAMFLSRCTLCGGTLARLEASEPGWPPALTARAVAASRCASCGHIYWDGTHVASIRARLGRFIHR